MDERLKRLIARREAAGKEREQLLAKRKAIVDLAEEEAREDLSTEEDTEFRDLTGQIEAKDEELRGFDERIAELTEEAERAAQVTEGAAALRRAQARVQVVSEARTYARGNGNSYARDLIRTQMNLDVDGSSAQRLARHASEVATDPEYRDLNREDGTGGYAVPPLWLMNMFTELARPGRALANLAANQSLPAGTDSINIPRVKTGTTVAVQTGSPSNDNQAVSETDMTDDFINAPVRTLAGQQGLAIQLLDQSPINFDEVVFRDLVAEYAVQVDKQVISGTGANGQVLGIRNTAGIETVTSDAATGTAAPGPQVADVYTALADAVQRVQTKRFMPPTAIVMHPRRWAWFLSSADTTGRPLVVPAANNPQNAVATVSGVSPEGVVGQMHGLPVVTDPNIPTNLGTGTNQDVMYVLRASDLLLYESGLRTRVLPEVRSETLTVLLQVYSYLAFTAARYPKSVVEVGGTNLVNPF